MLSQRQLFLQHVAQTSDAPLALEIESAQGVYLYDTSGKKYIDLISGINVSVLGHCHPKIVEAIQIQAAKYAPVKVPIACAKNGGMKCFGSNECMAVFKLSISFTFVPSGGRIN